MDIHFVGKTTAEAAGSHSLTSLTGGIGSAPLADDIVIVAVFGTNSSDQDISISGYEEVADLYANGTNDTNFGVFLKKMGGSPDTTVTIPSLTGVLAVVYVLRGVDTTTPQDTTATTATKTNSGIPDPAAINTVTDDAMIVILSATRDSSNFTAPSGFSNSVKEQSTSSVLVASKIKATAGSDNPGVWSGIFFDSSSKTTASVTMALRPAGAGGTGRIKVWNGSAWLSKPVKVWNGSAWVTRPVKRWNGSAWVTTNY